MNDYDNDESTVVLGDAVISGYEWPEGQGGSPLVDRESINGSWSLYFSAMFGQKLARKLLLKPDG